MIQPAILHCLNKRIAELIRQNEMRAGQPQAMILEELSELAIIRDELKKIQQRVADGPEPLSRCLPKEFPSLGALVHRLSSIARQIANTRKNDPGRPELLNEITRLYLAADSLYKREL